MVNLWNLLVVLSLLVLSAPQRCSGEDLDSVAVQENSTASASESQPNREEIRRLVQQFITTKNWATLRRGLEAVLDNSSDMYNQLRRVKYNVSHPLFHVGLVGSSPLVSLLLDAGLPVDAVTKSGGNTMLKGAVYNGHLPVVQLLLERGANVNAKDLYHMTPLMYAAERGYLAVSQALVSAGANTTATDNNNHPALYYATINYNREVVQYLQQL